MYLVPLTNADPKKQISRDKAKERIQQWVYASLGYRPSSIPSEAAVPYVKSVATLVS